MSVHPPSLSQSLTKILAIASTAALTLGMALVAIVLPAPAAAAAPLTVNVAGTLQVPLGCEEDWDTTCEKTNLEYKSNGLWEKEFTLPKGNYELKFVVNNNDWYGLTAEQNVPLSVAGDATLKFSFNEDSKKFSIAPTDLPEDYDLATDKVQKPVRQEGADQQFYFVMTDRFNNGDTGNDKGGLTGDRMVTGFDPSDEGFYHGGDLKGLQDKLDYIKGLGTTAIWLTPSFKNKPVQGTGTEASAGYHGYWITDFTQIDPHLGTNQDMKNLITAAHAKEMKVYFDIITNHTADVIQYTEEQPAPHWDSAVNKYVFEGVGPYRDAAGNVFDLHEAAVAAQNGNDFPELDAAVSFPKTPFVAASETDIKVPEWLNDPIYYHNRGNAIWENAEAAQQGDFNGLDDLMTEDPFVVNGFIDIYKEWIDLGIDGFRIDTVKHVNNEFWQQWSPAIMNYVKDQGKDDFYMFGEVYDGNPEVLSGYVTDAKLPGVLDFGFQWAATAFTKGESAEGLSSVFKKDAMYDTAGTSAHSLPTFLGNHDMGRIGYFLKNKDNALERDKLAHSLMYLTRGQPVIYYGDEQGFAGNGGDKSSRQDMFPTEVAEYQNQTTLTGGAGNANHFQEDNALYQHIADLGKLRAEHPALGDGAQVERWTDGQLYAFSRIENSDDPTEILAALNNSTGSKTVTVQTYTPNATFKNIYHSTDVTSDADGNVTLTVPALSAVAFEADTKIPHTKLASNKIVLPAGSKLDGKVQVEAQIQAASDATTRATGSNAPARVVTTFSYRIAGQSDWTILGSADGEQKAYHDTSNLPAGTLVEYRAVSVGLDGSKVASSSYGFVGYSLPELPPMMVTVPGTFGGALGCEPVGSDQGNWQPDCAALQLNFDEGTGVYQATFDIPAGTYKYKVAIGGSWAENYGAKAVKNGEEISITVAQGSKVTFLYDPVTHYVKSNAEARPLITLPGTIGKYLGCNLAEHDGNWQPDCVGAWMKDIQETGTYTFSTAKVPGSAVEYEVKAAKNLSWGGEYPGANYKFLLGEGKQLNCMYTWTNNGANQSLGCDSIDIPVTGMEKSRAYWIDEGTLAFPAGDLPDGLRYTDPSLKFALRHSDTAAITGTTLTAGTSVDLGSPGALTSAQLKAFPELKSGYVALKINQTRAEIQKLLTEQLVFQISTGQTLRVSTGVQTAGVLDALYAAAAKDLPLGVTFDDDVPSFRIWAPTAQKVNLLTWATEAATGAETKTPMTFDEATGTWFIQGTAAMKNMPYRFELTVYEPVKVPRVPGPEPEWIAAKATGTISTVELTDPYSVSLTLGSTHSVAVDLKDPAFMPEEWLTAEAPVVINHASMSIYELHVRDFSVGDTTVPAEYQGKYLAFTVKDSDGMKHLKKLSDAGLTTIHLLPTFDIASIPEDPAVQEEPNYALLKTFPANSDKQQEQIALIAAEDAFNWGYDPLHYNAPEGSYATEAYGGKRVAEFRSMIGGLHSIGLQVVTDMVYNHTAAAGTDDLSILDRAVPGYYHRTNEDGGIWSSTCCQNVATENAMADKLMVDSVVQWARDYHVDGFRFDLMGHHSKQNMLNIKEALADLTMEKDGIDGKSIYLYGEGWNFGEVGNNARFTQASQGNLGGTGIGTFSDRLRDAVRGGNHGYGPGTRGFATGQQDPGTLRSEMDTIQLGMAGNLSEFQFTSAVTGNPILGKNVSYNGSAAGYATSPEEAVSYVDAHDNETLYDALVAKLPTDTPMAERIRYNTIALATVALGQSPMFWHAGTDLLRSKSLDADSYNSGDWFNVIDWTGEVSGFGRGLPPENRNAQYWNDQRPLLGNTSFIPSRDDAQLTAGMSEDLVKLRYSSPLFTLGDAQRIQQKVSFPKLDNGSVPGLIAMYLDDTQGTKVDPALDGVLVMINATKTEQAHAVEGLSDLELELSPILVDGADDRLKTGATWDSETGTVTVPPLSVAVFTREAVVSEPPVIVEAITTEVSGTGVAGATIRVVGPADAVLCDEVPVTDEGKWSCSFDPEQAVDTEIRAFQTEPDLPESGPAGGVIAERTETPVITEVLPGSITGTGVEGARVTVRDASGVPLCTATVAAGKWSCTYAPDQAGKAKVIVTQRKSLLSESLAAEGTVKETLPAPGITEAVTTGVSGTGSDGATVTVKNASGVQICSDVVVDGKWSCDFMPVMAPEAAITAMQSQTGKIDSAVTNGKIAKRTATPVISEAVPASAAGTGITGATVTVTDAAGGTLCTVPVVDGKWSCKFATKQNPNTVVSAVQKAPNFSVSLTATATVKDTLIAPVITEAVTTGVKGAGTNGATVTVKDVAGKILCTTQVSGSSWSCVFATAVTPGTKITAVQTQDGKISSPLTTGAIAPATAPPVITDALLGSAGGTGVNGAVVTVKDAAGKTLCMATVAGGKWTCALSAKQKLGSTISAIQQAPKQSVSTVVTAVVKDTLPAPVIVTAVTTGAGGTGSNGATVTVKDSAGKKVCSAVVAGGKWSCVFAAALAPGAKLSAMQTQLGMLDSPATAGTVAKRSATPVMSAVAATEAIGTGVTGATVTVKDAAGKTLCTATVTAGKWSCTFATTQKAGAKVLATQQAPGLSVSTAATGTVKVPEPQKVSAAPKFVAVISTGVTGTGVNGATVTVKDSAGKTLCTVPVTAGKWSCTFTSVMAPDAKITATQVEAGKLTSAVVSGMIAKATAAPKVTEALVGSASGTGVSGATVTVTDAAGKTLCTATVAGGKWSCQFATTQKVNAKVSVDQQAPGLSVSKAATGTVKDIKAPEPLKTSATPTISMAQTTGVNGTGVNGAVITVLDAQGKRLCTATVAGGTWSCAFTKVIAAAAKITATQTESGKQPSKAVAAAISKETWTIQRTRYAGASRYETSLNVASAFLQKGRPLFVATGASFPDALSVSPAAAKENGTLILTNPKSMDPAMIQLIKARVPSVVYIVGGKSAVSENVKTQVQKAVGSGVKIERLAGESRYGTSAKIYEKFFVNDSAYTEKTVFVATGRSFPDALSASAAGGTLGRAVLLVDGKGNGPDKASVALLKKQGVKEAVVIGGVGVVNAKVFGALGRTVKTTRLSGDDRFATSLKLNALVDGHVGIDAPTDLWFATGANFPDALSAAAQAGTSVGRLYLSRPGCVPDSAASAVSAKDSQVRRIHVVGGKSVLSDAVLNTKACTN